MKDAELQVEVERSDKLYVASTLPVREAANASGDYSASRPANLAYSAASCFSKQHSTCRRPPRKSTP